MENARLLDERLRRIIKEVGSRTGDEIKSLMIGDFSREVDRITGQNNERQLIRLLTLLKKSIDEI